MVEFLLAMACGLFGGFVRALQKNGGLVAPNWDTDEDEKTLFDPGFLGTAFVGIAAGLGVWLLSASPANPGIGYGPLGLALFAGAAGDVVIDYYVNQQYGASEQQGAGDTIEQMASATNNQSREVEQAHEERRQLQQTVENLRAKVDELQAENDRLKKSGAPDD